MIALAWRVSRLHCAICNHEWVEVHPTTIPAGSGCSKCGYMAGVATDDQ